MRLPKVDADQVAEFTVNHMPPWGWLAALAVVSITSYWLAGKAFDAGGKLLEATRSVLHDKT